MMIGAIKIVLPFMMYHSVYNTQKCVYDLVNVYYSFVYIPDIVLLMCGRFYWHIN